ncbi:mitochondrial import receptor subunit Tom22 [Coemansia sp. RSA 486]|nr:mitochondrial import receptor subunit Tom22 [Coemansia sp. RSA 486]KAJ2602148.1 mitochondrial import receptor subunit Tom22 [Coemansia sp. RSA 1721]
MVKFVEIEEEEIYDDNDSQYTTDSEDEASGAQKEDDSDAEDSASDLDTDDEENEYDDDDDDYLEESLLERLSALKDIIPAEQRSAITGTISSIGSWGKFGLSLAGKLGWIFTTSALLVVFPLAIESDREKMMQQWEAEQNGMAAGGPHGAPMGGAMPPQHQPGMPGMPGIAPGIAPGVVA